MTACTVYASPAGDILIAEEDGAITLVGFLKQDAPSEASEPPTPLLAEAVRQLPFLSPDGCVVVSNRPVVPVSAVTGGPAYDFDGIMAYLRKRVGHLVEVDADQAAADLGSAKCLNVVLLGAAARSGALGLSTEDISGAVGRLVPARFQDLNARALMYA